MVRDVGIGAGEEEKGEGGRRYHSRDGVLTQEQARGGDARFQECHHPPVSWIDA